MSKKRNPIINKISKYFDLNICFIMKSKFIKSTFILIIGGAITKLMAMVIKIFLTRSIGDKGIGLYMLIMPTFNLFITLCTFIYYVMYNVITYFN